MAFTALYESSVSVSTTELSLVSGTSSFQSITTDGVFQVFLDLNAVTGTDVFEFKVKEKVQAAGTQRVFQHITFSGSQGSEPHWFSPTYVLLHGWDVTLKRLAGSDRTIAWSIRQVA